MAELQEVTLENLNDGVAGVLFRREYQRVMDNIDNAATSATAKRTIDHPDCKTRIHRGLAYVCGDMHGSDEHSCEGYFCDDHRTPVEVEPGRWLVICVGCAAEHEEEEADDG